ncbi:MAG: GNAT family N-acetyltransferase [Candidatus Binatia bacterium]
MTEVRVLSGVAEAPREAWNALVGEGSPFLEWDWLATLEDTACVGPGTGWRPQPLTLWENGRLTGACPLYVKDDGQGEFVFDHGWAQAAERAGMSYYPKLLVAVPFTPVPGARLLAAPGCEAAVAATLAAVLEDACTRAGISSVHVNFCTPQEVAALAARGWIHRTGYQYHWHGEALTTFDDYLATLRHKRRNQVRREQRELAAQEVTVTAHVGTDVPADLMPVVFALYRRTLAAHGPWGHQYLTGRFFDEIRSRFAHRLCVIVARQRGEVVAATLNVQKGRTLYGRYWGTFRPLRHLHFNVAYYAAIAHCIAQGLTCFEPGAGGEFKQMRGFDAQVTHSMHWVRDPRLAAAVRAYLVEERAAVAAEVAWWDERTARRRDGGD